MASNRKVQQSSSHQGHFRPLFAARADDRSAVQETDVFWTVSGQPNSESLRTPVIGQGAWRPALPAERGAYQMAPQITPPVTVSETRLAAAGRTQYQRRSAGRILIA